MIDLITRRRAMMGASDNIIYSLKDVNFDGTSSLNTGILLMDGRDFEMHINFTPKALSTSYKYFACRNSYAPLSGIDFRYASSKWDVVGNNSDNYFTLSPPQVDVAVDVLITRQNRVTTASVDGETKVINTGDSILPLYIASTSTGGAPFAKLYLNELTIKEL